MDILLRRRFELPADPWGGAPALDTADAIRAGHLVRAAAEARILVSIHGPRGAGKTHAIRAALVGIPRVRLVEPLRLDRERLTLGDVQTAIVRELCDEAPRHSGEARSGQTRRVLGAADGSVVLWIDDAHLLHHATLRGLKRLLEVRWRGRGPLLGIVLSGQADRTAAVPEVGLRSDRMRLAGLTAAEAGRALTAALGARIEAGAVAPLAESDAARNWLDLQALVDTCLAAAAARGEERITAGAVDAVLGTVPAEERAPASDKDVADFLRATGPGRRRAVA